MPINVFFQKSSYSNSNKHGPKYTMVVAPKTWTQNIHAISIPKMVYNNYNYHQIFKCHSNCLSFLNPNVVCHIELSQHFSRPQDLSSAIQPSPCSLPQGPLKLPTLAPIH